MKSGVRPAAAIILGANKPTHVRRVFTRRDGAYLRWRFVTNAVPTLRKYLSSHLFADTAERVGELRKSGIFVGSSSQLLSNSGQATLACLWPAILEKAASPEVKDIIEGRQPNT